MPALTLLILVATEVSVAPGLRDARDCGVIRFEAIPRVPVGAAPGIPLEAVWVTWGALAAGLVG